MKMARQLTLLAVLVLLAGCSVNGASPAQTSKATSDSAATAQSVTVTSDSVIADSLAGATAIADNFSFASGIEPTWYGPSGRGGVPAIEALTELGAFRLDCLPGQLLNDDPLFYPGQPGAAHLHLFWGNSGTNANSTYQSLRTSGGSSCGTVQSAPVNRSAYWTPAMIIAPGFALKPDHIMIYYKRFAATSPACTGPNRRGICVDLPNGIRFVTGYNMNTLSGGPADLRPGQWDYNFMSFDCWGSKDGTIGQGGATGEYHTIADVAAAGCPSGARLHVAIDSPECWDGVNLDTPDHRSHMTYATGVDFGYGRQCDAQHPYLIPMMTVQLFYNTDANFVAGKWHLSSDEMVTGAVAGSTLHIDYWEAWSPQGKAVWMKNCINAPSSCSGGDLGDGTAIIGANEPWPAGWPKQVPVALTNPTTPTTTPTTSPSTTPSSTQTCPDGTVVLTTQTCPTTTTSKPGKGVGRKK
jgi:hypothetical protein